MRTISRTLIFAFIIAIFCQNDANAQHTRPDNGYLYDDEVVLRIDVEIDTDSLNLLLDPSNLRSNHEYRVTCIIRKSEEIDTVENVGFRLRGNTSRLADKKSFKLSFNTYESGRKYKGVEKINLNGEHNDPSIIRAKLTWDLFADMGVPSARVNYSQLYINGSYRGLYLNVEHIDEEFIKKRFEGDVGNLYKCLYPANLHYINSNPNSYKIENFGMRTYDLKTNKDEDNYAILANMIQKLNLDIPQNFQCKIEEVLDVNTVIKAMAVDVMTSNWDGVINQNNFYLYEDSSTGKVVFIPYDVDNTFGIDWFGIDWGRIDIYDYFDEFGYRPLYQKMLALPEFRTRFNYYLTQLIENIYTEQNLTNYLETYKNRIFPFRISDTFANMDYGWSVTEWSNSFDAGLSGHAPYGIKPFIATRREKALEQLELYNLTPILSNLHIQHKEDSAEVSVNIVEDGAIVDATIHYQLDNGDWQSIPLQDDGDDMYSATIAFTGQPLMQYYISVTDDTNQSRDYPMCGEYETLLGYSETPDLVINEILASNTNVNTDEAGEYDDWIEIYNQGLTAVLLSDYYLSDDPQSPNKWQLPEITLQPDNYFLIWADEDGSQGDHHANFKLSKSGESVGIYDSAENNFAPVDELHFGEQTEDITFGRSPNGFGDFTNLAYASPGANNDIDTAIKDHTGQYFSIMPNPALDIIYLDIDNGVYYQIFDINGKLLIADKYYNQIEVSELNSGIYFLSVENIISKLTIVK